MSREDTRRALRCLKIRPRNSKQSKYVNHHFSFFEIPKSGNRTPQLLTTFYFIPLAKFNLAREFNTTISLLTCPEKIMLKFGLTFINNSEYHHHNRTDFTNNLVQIFKDFQKPNIKEEPRLKSTKDIDNC